MKDEWERDERFYPLNREQISRVTELVFHNSRVASFEPIGTGFRNTNYKISLEDSSEPFVLRLYKGEGKIASKEMSISKLVGKTVPVAGCIRTNTSCRILDSPWSIFEWKPGILLSEMMKAGDEFDIAPYARAVGKVLAEIHKYRFSDHGFLGPNLEVETPFILDGENFLQLIVKFLKARCGEFLGEQVSNGLLEFCKTNSDFLTENREEPVLVHSDYNGLNILMDYASPSASVSAVLDWEFAFSGSRYADIGNMLRYEGEDSVFERYFIRGYTEGGHNLDPNWRILAKLQDVVALCDLLNRSTLRSPNRIRDLRRLIGNTLAK